MFGSGEYGGDGVGKVGVVGVPGSTGGVTMGVVGVGV